MRPPRTASLSWPKRGGVCTSVSASSWSTKCSSSARSSCRRESIPSGEVAPVAARRRTTARTAALPVRRALPELVRLAPSGRSILVGLAILVAAVGGYALARETSMFGVQTLEVRGGTPELRRQVEAALGDEVGRSLLRVNAASIDQRVSALPGVRSFTYDRDFPHTLRVTVRAEHPVLIVRQGTQAFLVAASGRVLRTLAHPTLSRLPRLYVKKDVTLDVGSTAPPVVTG